MIYDTSSVHAIFLISMDSNRIISTTSDNAAVPERTCGSGAPLVSSGVSHNSAFDVSFSASLCTLMAVCSTVQPITVNLLIGDPDHSLPQQRISTLFLLSIAALNVFSMLSTTRSASFLSESFEGPHPKLRHFVGSTGLFLSNPGPSHSYLTRSRAPKASPPLRTHFEVQPPPHPREHR